MAESTYLAISLYNNTETTPSRRQEANKVTVATFDHRGTPLNRSMGEIIHRRPYKIHLHQVRMTDTAWKFIINPQIALSGGQLTIESPRQLCNTIFCVQLPVHSLLENGLKITLFPPNELHPNVSFYNPTNTTMARLTLKAINRNDDQQQLITANFIGNKPTVVTKISERPLQVSSMYQAKLLIDANVEPAGFPSIRPTAFKLPQDPNIIIQTRTVSTPPSSNNADELIRILSGETSQPEQ